MTGEYPVTTLFEMANHAMIARGKKASPIYRYAANLLLVPRKMLQEWVQGNTTSAVATKNAEFHYGAHPKLFELMLGDTVGYSEGYWTEDTHTLDQAKHNNYEYICRKLRLKPGDRVLEVGSGWGYMPIYMVKKYGVSVTVYNPVKRQNEYMRERFEKHHVADKIRIVEGEHRDILREPEGSFDTFVAIGVHEHHGMHLRQYDEWWAAIAHVLKPGGIGVISTSTLMQRIATSYLILKYIFPGGHLPSLPHDLMAMDAHGMTLVEVENLWPHYQKTLMEWRRRFSEQWPEIQKADPAFFTEQFRRAWSMYLEGTVQVFNQSLDLSHIVFTNGRSAQYYPWTREGKYAGDFRGENQRVECYENLIS